MNPYANVLGSEDASPAAKKRKLDPDTRAVEPMCQPVSRKVDSSAIAAPGVQKETAANKRSVDVSEALAKLKSFLSNAKYVSYCPSIALQCLVDFFMVLWQENYKGCQHDSPIN